MARAEWRANVADVPIQLDACAGIAKCVARSFVDYHLYVTR